MPLGSRHLSSIGAIVTVLANCAPAWAGSPIKDDEEVILFATAAHRVGQDWRAPLHAWIFEPEPDSVWRSGATAAVRAVLEVDDGDPAAARFREIAGWFLADSERGKRLELEVGGRVVTLPGSGKDGRSRTHARLPGAPPGWITVTTRARDGRRFTGTIQLIPERGVTVVSDIDDTIKETGVLEGNRRVLQRTFLEPFEPVPDMFTAYRRWAAEGAVFHYVSGSPWQLYPALTRFLAEAAFPQGTLDLREFRVKDRRRWNLVESPRRHKLAAIGDLLRRYPERRFLLIGDSGESDPEIYGELARRHRAQVSAIAIRRLAGDRFPAERARRAFAGVRARVIEFRAASELPSLAEL